MAAAKRRTPAPPQAAAKRPRFALAIIAPSGLNADLPGTIVCHGAPLTTDQRADATMSDAMVPHEAPSGFELDSAEQSHLIECPVCSQSIEAERPTQRKRNSALAEHLNTEHAGALDHEEIAKLIEREELFRCQFCYLLFGYRATHHEMVRCGRNPTPIPADRYEIDSRVRNADSRMRYKRLSGGCASFALTSAPRGRDSITPASLLLTHRNEPAFNNETAVTDDGEPGATAEGESDGEPDGLTQEPLSPEDGENGTQQYAQPQTAPAPRPQQPAPQAQPAAPPATADLRDADVAPPVATALAFLRDHVPPDSTALLATRGNSLEYLGTQDQAVVLPILSEIMRALTDGHGANLMLEERWILLLSMPRWLLAPPPPGKTPVETLRARAADFLAGKFKELWNAHKWEDKLPTVAAYARSEGQTEAKRREATVEFMKLAAKQRRLGQGASRMTDVPKVAPSPEAYSKLSKLLGFEIRYDSPLAANDRRTAVWRQRRFDKPERAAKDLGLWLADEDNKKELVKKWRPRLAAARNKKQPAGSGLRTEHIKVQALLRRPRVAVLRALRSHRALRDPRQHHAHRSHRPCHHAAQASRRRHATPVRGLAPYRHGRSALQGSVARAQQLDGQGPRPGDLPLRSDGRRA